MAFDPNKDVELKRWKCEETGLLVTINRYGEGQAKVQIGPRVFTKKDGKESQRKAGRLNVEDFLWFYDIIDEVKEELTRLVEPE
jgi:hypothetical protein